MHPLERKGGVEANGPQITPHDNDARTSWAYFSKSSSPANARRLRRENREGGEEKEGEGKPRIRVSYLFVEGLTPRRKTGET